MAVSVVHAMLGNAAIAAVLAVAALVVAWTCRSAAIRHAAWLIVLVKLVTPPLVSIPIPILPASWAASASPPANGVVILLPTTDPERAVIEPMVPAPPGWERYRPSDLAGWAILAWAFGSFAWFAWQGRRIIRFRRRIASAEEPPEEVAVAARGIATALGIARPPSVKLATGIGSPMLWGWGRDAVVLFPRDLLSRLSPEARDTLLAHELAHYLRRDHWVRILEYIATGLYWWHPAVWLARRGIEIAEEECCDAWVVAGLAASPRRYAEALLATVDFEAELRRPCLPPGACAANHSAKLLHRRLIGIIDARRPRRLRGGAATRFIVLAALLTQPVLRAAVSEPTESRHEPGGVVNAKRPPAPKPRPAPKTTEPRSWASAEAPGGTMSVLARDHEVVLRRADGSTRVLGPGRPLALAFAPGGQRFATAGPGPLVRMWDERGNAIGETRVAAPARAVAYTPDGSRLLVLDAAGGISVRHADTLAVVSDWSLDRPANSIVCSPDGRTIAVSFGSWLGEAGLVECWSIDERRKLASYHSRAPIGACRFTPDGKRLVVGGWNGMVAWRSLPGGELIAERQLTKDVVATAAFCPDAGTLPLDPPPEPVPPPSSFPLLGQEMPGDIGHDR